MKSGVNDVSVLEIQAAGTPSGNDDRGAFDRGEETAEANSRDSTGSTRRQAGAWGRHADWKVGR